MNVHDYLKNMTVEEIKSFYSERTIPCAAAMLHVTGDFNLGTLIRNSNFFGFERVIYVGGKKQYDRRGCVGSHNYIDVDFVKTEDEFITEVRNLKYKIIAIENNTEHQSINFFDFVNDIDVDKVGPVIFVFGEEQRGLSTYILDHSDVILHIPSRGTVRSLNVGTTSGIVLGCYSNLYF
jgi:tRNA G18 (ribose-2'-O)-methylase SpoU